jgi:hypothetical protein
MVFAHTFTDSSWADDVFPAEWKTKLQERLSYNTNWKEVCDVIYTDTKTIFSPYMSTVPSLQSHTRGTPYTYQVFTITSEYVTINQSQILGIPIDRADLAQLTFVKAMDLANLQGQLVNEYLETDMLANHGMWTNFDQGTLDTGTADTNAITVSLENIFRIIGVMKQKISEANGDSLASRNGMFIIWRPADFEILENFAAANGYNTADYALKSGIDAGFIYRGVYHYKSNKHTSGHVFGGVKKLFTLGILKSTYGDTQFVDEPATADGALSAVGVVTRIDWEFKAWTNTAGLLFDIIVA